VSSTDGMRQNLIDAQENIRIASQNINNEDTFNLNIEQASDAIASLEAEKLFLSDVQILKDRIGILQKQFNGIEAFITNSENTIYSF
jgi:acetylglutamate kinase